MKVTNQDRLICNMDPFPHHTLKDYDPEGSLHIFSNQHQPNLCIFLRPDHTREKVEQTFARVQKDLRIFFKNTLPSYKEINQNKELFDTVFFNTSSIKRNGKRLYHRDGLVEKNADLYIFISIVESIQKFAELHFGYQDVSISIVERMQQFAELYFGYQAPQKKP